MSGVQRSLRDTTKREQVHVTQMTQIAYTPKQAARATAVDLDLLKDCIRTRTLPAKDAEGDPIVLHEDLAAWVLTLPTWER